MSVAPFGNIGAASGGGGITAGDTANVLAFGNVTSQVSAQKNAFVTAGGKITQTVSGNLLVVARARGGDISGSVTSSKGTAVALAVGDITQAVTAGKDAFAAA